MTTFPYQYAPMPTSTTNLPPVDNPPATTQTESGIVTDIGTNISNLIDSVKKFDTTTLMMVGGSILILFIIFK